MPIHSIKLKGPWTVYWRPDGAAAPGHNPCTVHLPLNARSLFGDASGTAEFERRFNRPTGLSSRHRVCLRLTGVTELLGIRINGVLLPSESDCNGTHVVDLTEFLNPHNLLAVEVRMSPREPADVPTGLWQPVVLEIEEPD